jgi:hypothetical protein
MCLEALSTITDLIAEHAEAESGRDDILAEEAGGVFESCQEM